MARPKCDERLIERAVRLKKGGANNIDIARAVGVAESTFYRWYSTPGSDLEREFSESLKKAEADYKNALLGIIAKASQDRDWKAAAWLLERKYPDEYGRRERHEVVAEVDSRLQLQDAGASPDVLEKAEELLELLYGDGR